MANVYILHSKKLNKFYIGSCQNLHERLEKHINKTFQDSYTSNSDDWELFLDIADLAYLQARAIEHHIKKMKSKVYIQNLSAFPEIIEKLKLKYI
ncbi:MAG: GIY-YIG nuclease family protein [Flavobacteriia bacterium]|jgi:putative endonuclease